MISLNRVTLIGRLGQDPEIRHLENGVAVGRFSLATSDRYRDKDGNWQERPTEWHNIVVWRGLAERAQKELKKGMAIYVEGQINYRNYDDKDGNSRKITDILARSFRAFVDTRGEGGSSAYMPGEEHDPQSNYPQDSNASAPTSSTTSSDFNDGGTDDGDDLPF